MRVIAGSRRGTGLVTPEGEHTRPTTDKTKETLFNVLMQDIWDSRFLDLFSGSGGIAIEALSRGAACAYMVENDKRAVACIRSNLKKVRFEEPQAVLYTGDYKTALEQMSAEHKEFDLVFMDPPYHKGLEKEALSLLKEKKLLSRDAVVVAEAALDTDFSYIDELGYRIWKVKSYKTNQHVFLLHREEE